MQTKTSESTNATKTGEGTDCSQTTGTCDGTDLNGKPKTGDTTDAIHVSNELREFLSEDSSGDENDEGDEIEYSENEGDELTILLRFAKTFATHVATSVPEVLRRAQHVRDQAIDMSVLLTADMEDDALRRRVKGEIVQSTVATYDNIMAEVASALYTLRFLTQRVDSMQMIPQQIRIQILKQQERKMIQEDVEQQYKSRQGCCGYFLSSVTCITLIGFMYCGLVAL